MYDEWKVQFSSALLVCPKFDSPSKVKTTHEVESLFEL